MQHHKGFSLLEILVAFGIMAIALTIVMRIFGSGVNTAINSEDYTVAVQLAESLMNRTGVEIPLTVGQLSGVEANKYEWSVTTQPMAPPAFTLLAMAEAPRKLRSQPGGDEQKNPFELMSVRVIIAWGDEDQRRRSLELKSVKLFVAQAL